jgi:hypothetical protein
LHSYQLVGGVVTLRLTKSRAFLVSVVPEPGYTVHRWSSATWLRVDFDQGGNQASSLLASWNQHAPTVTISA